MRWWPLVLGTAVGLAVIGLTFVACYWLFLEIS